MNVTLTRDDVTDLKAGRSINALAEDGVEVAFYPDQFMPPTWAMIEAYGLVTLDTYVYESSQQVTVTVQIAREPEPIHGDDLPRPSDQPDVPMDGDRW